MSIFKSFLASDVIVSPFKVNKSFTFKGNELTGSNVEIDRYVGKNITSSLFTSGSNPTGFINTQDQFLVYRSIRELYYSNYIFGIKGSPANTASFNNDGIFIISEFNQQPNVVRGGLIISGSEFLVGI